MLHLAFTCHSVLHVPLHVSYVPLGMLHLAFTCVACTLECVVHTLPFMTCIVFGLSDGRTQSHYDKVWCTQDGTERFTADTTD